MNEILAMLVWSFRSNDDYVILSQIVASTLQQQQEKFARHNSDHFVPQWF